MTIDVVKHKHLILLLVLPLASCDNNVVSRAEYDAVVARADSLEAQNDSLQFELSSLKMYVERLEEENEELIEELKHTP